MAREVRHDECEPEIFDADDLGDDGKLYVCRCGLSENGALCDGSHNATVDETDGVVYKYDDDTADAGRRIVEGFESADE